MADLVKFTIDGRELEAPAGALVIDVAKKNGIEIPSFCYYEGLSLQAACRMCLVEVEKAPKLLVACTLPVAAGMVVRTTTPQVQQARKSMLELLLTNHPLDCPVCDKGGECELQDMAFRYGADESRFSETKQHVDEKQYSPVVFFDAPRCILCYRCIRVCNEGMGVAALGVVNRGVTCEIAPNKGDHLECDECGMCIDICPVGALTSGAYRYQSRPWEMDHVGTICTHCSNGCKTTLSVRNDEILRGNNRDRSGVNGEFLCIKGRYAYDFYNHPERLTAPLMKVNGKLEPVSWSQALSAVGAKFKSVRAAGGTFGVVGSNHTSNEENFYLQKFARTLLGTDNIDHHRTGDVLTLVDALSGKQGKLATTADLYEKKAVLIIGADLALEQPLLSWQIRANYRHHAAKIYVVTEAAVREDDYAAATVRGSDYTALREQLAKETELVIVFGASVKGDALRQLVDFGEGLGNAVSYICCLDYSNSRGAVDMGLYPQAGGMNLDQMLAAELDVLWVVGANPLKNGATAKAGFVVAQEMFLTETARQADVVFPAASGYEKNGTVTNVCGEVQRLKQGLNRMGTKPDLEIIGLIAKEMGLAAAVGPWIPDTVFAEIRKTVHGYDVPAAVLMTGGAAQTRPINGRAAGPTGSELVRSDRNGLFTSGTLGRYSKILNSVVESRLKR